MENNEKAYYEKVDIDNELKLRKQLAALPPYYSAGAYCMENAFFDTGVF